MTANQKFFCKIWTFEKIDQKSQVFDSSVVPKTYFKLLFAYF